MCALREHENLVPVLEPFPGWMPSERTVEAVRPNLGLRRRREPYPVMTTRSEPFDNQRKKAAPDASCLVLGQHGEDHHFSGV